MALETDRKLINGTKMGIHYHEKNGKYPRGNRDSDTILFAIAVKWTGLSMPLRI